MPDGDRQVGGKHAPLVSREVWERVQHVLDGRHAKKHRRVKHEFAFSGLIACGHCGCSVVGEVNKDPAFEPFSPGWRSRRLPLTYQILRHRGLLE